MKRVDLKGLNFHLKVIQDEINELQNEVNERFEGLKAAIKELYKDAQRARKDGEWECIATDEAVFFGEDEEDDSN